MLKPRGINVRILHLALTLKQESKNYLYNYAILILKPNILKIFFASSYETENIGFGILAFLLESPLKYSFPP